VLGHEILVANSGWESLYEDHFFFPGVVAELGSGGLPSALMAGLSRIEILLFLDAASLVVEGCILVLSVVAPKRSLRKLRSLREVSVDASLLPTVILTDSESLKLSFVGHLHSSHIGALSLGLVEHPLEQSRLQSGVRRLLESQSQGLRVWLSLLLGALT